MDILDIGCGWKKTPGAIGMDRLAESAADVVADLEHAWPFPDNSFDVVVAHHVLEHVADMVHVVNEAWRVLRPGGVFRVAGPHFSSPDLVWSDPTHRRGLSLAMFHHFEPDTAHPYAQGRFRIQTAQLRTGASEAPVVQPWQHLTLRVGKAIESAANRSALSQQRAERIVSRFYPFAEVYVELLAVKGPNTTASRS